MKVYFGATANQLNEFREDYKRILEVIQNHGDEVLTTHDILSTDQNKINQAEDAFLQNIYRQWRSMISQTDVAVVEASLPSSFQMGAVVGSLIEKGKPIIVLYKKDRDPLKFTTESFESKLIKLEYDKQTLKDTLIWGLDEARRWLERRFTMIMTAELDSFIEKASKINKLSKSEYIRSLVQCKIDKTKD